MPTNRELMAKALKVAARKEVLILCTHNSARSIMAEFLVNKELEKSWYAMSAGTNPTSVKPEVFKVMQEIGISLEGAQSKPVDQFIRRKDLDLVITVCEEAREQCPTFYHPVERVHVDIEDPENFEGQGLSDEEKLQVYRRTRDEIQHQVLGELRKRYRASDKEDGSL